MREFTTKEKPPSEPVTFSVDGREMEFRNPGWAPVILGSGAGTVADQARRYLDWLGAGLPDEDGEWLLGRLLDPNDNFEIPDVTDLFVGLIEEITGRPTVPPTDSLPSEQTPASTDGRHLATSTQN